MFLAIIFLSLAATGAYFFPDSSWAAILGVSFACVASLRLILFFTGRAKPDTDKDNHS